MRAEKIARPTPPIRPDLTGGLTYELFSAHPDRTILAVVAEDGRPVGIVNRDRFFVQMADKFGRALWEKRAVAQLMRANPKLVGADTTIEALGADLLASQPEAIADGFIVVDADGRYCGVVSSLDLVIASLRQVERQNAELLRMTGELQRASAEAQAASRAKTDFLAMMSHEIRTPLNGVLGMGAVLAGSALNPIQRGQLDLILQSGQALHRILGDILDVSKIEAGRLEIERAPFDAEDLVAQACTLHAATAQGRGVALVRTPSDTALPRRCLGDGLRIGQVLGNLISNAVKFTTEGEIRVAARVVGDDGGQAWLTVSVTDTGIGMTSDQLERAFDPFVQADISTTRVHGGTGLGLSICKQLVSLLGGRIAAESRLGAGSRFEFSAPIAVEIEHVRPTPTTPKPAAPIAFPDRALRVLIVEDDECNQRVVAAMLDELRADTTVVSGADAALEALQTGGFHLVLTDVHMPDTDGPSLVAEMRRRETASKAPRTAVVAVSANTLPDVRVRCLDAGMDGFVSKPINPVRLYAAINDALRASRRAREASSNGAETQKAAAGRVAALASS